MQRKILMSCVLWLALFESNVNAQELINDKIDVIAGPGQWYLNCVLYKPRNFDPSVKYPLVLFFHGMGSAGTDINRMYNSGLPRVLQEGYIPPIDFVMVAPQHDSYSLDVDHLQQVIDESFKKFPNLDPARIYLTGFSAGGWTIYQSQLNVDTILAKKFAAIAVISGATQDANTNNLDWWKITKTPLWAIAGANDISYRQQNQYMVDEVNERVPGLASITIRSGTGHNAWPDVYDGVLLRADGKNIWQWLYQFTRTANPPPRNLPPVARAGNDVTITLPNNSVQLNGSSSSDADGTIAAYSWTKIAGPSQYSISNPGIANPTVSNLVAGTYTFRLTVTDNGGATTSDDMNITVNSQPAAQRVLIDIGEAGTGSPDQWGKYWNNMTSAQTGLRVNNAITITNTVTPIKLEVTHQIGGASYETGLSISGTVGSVGDYPASATNDNAFAHNSIINGQWKIYGLDPERTYTTKFWGSRAQYTGSRFIQIKRADETAWQEYNASLNTNYNTAASFTFTGRTEMLFDIRVKTGSTYAYINLVDITVQ